eukprot:CAMPEP_0171496858 /NCGR_PEP_ID=MMETSP0958-20121227/6939_1 /TAXON_ID=87120 /ORGANISM="Aurantiochytrium limacinum, Strain ATCCMYA-1381" /LENGTH=318 /DNA_ID=CAMNT_0012031015 /DNA_START=152 /DNA_END=1108 /DNA_ORIENTATION=-
MSDDEYNQPLQIAGLFIIMVASAMGFALSAALHSAHKLGCCGLKPIVALIVLLKGLGCGIVVTTATIHLLNEAPEYFEDAGWDGYESWQWVFALAGVFISSLGDMMQRRQGHGNTATVEELQDLVQAGHGHGGEEEIKDLEKTSIADSSADSTESKARRSIMDAVVLEANILIHSILIGFDLGLQVESDWRPLLIALVFHQFFEGFALAEVIANSHIKSKVKILCMAAAYSLTTPIGVAIGIGTHSTYDGESTQVALLLAILNSICGGILLYLGMISLLLPWIVASRGLHRAPALYPALAFLGLAIGMTIMAVLAMWA